MCHKGILKEDRNARISLPNNFFCLGNTEEAIHTRDKENGYITTLELGKPGPNTLVQGSLIKLVWTMCLMSKAHTGLACPSLNSPATHQK